MVFLMGLRYIGGFRVGHGHGYLLGSPTYRGRHSSYAMRHVWQAGGYWGDTLPTVMRCHELALHRSHWHWVPHNTSRCCRRATSQLGTTGGAVATVITCAMCHVWCPRHRWLGPWIFQYAEMHRGMGGGHQRQSAEHAGGLPSSSPTEGGSTRPVLLRPGIDVSGSALTCVWTCTTLGSPLGVSGSSDVSPI
jgi:hypothetical protein